MQSVAKRKRPVARIVAGVFAALFLIIAGYTALDMRQGKTMAADACSRAVIGAPLVELLPLFPATDYRVVKGPDKIFLVPRKGMGRFNCTLTHDGQKVTGAEVTFTD